MPKMEITNAMLVKQFVVSVGLANTAVIGSNPNRKGIVLQNKGANVISIVFDGAATTALGLNLAANQVFQFNQDAAYTGAINAITVTGATNLLVIEFQ